MPVVFSGDVADLLRLAYAGMKGQTARSANSAVADWNRASRLNPARAAADHMDDRRIGEAISSMRTHTEAALQNLERRATVGVGSR